MPRIAKDAPREIIEDFAKEIFQAKKEGPKPQTHVIDFRDEMVNNLERPVYSIPVNLLRYRKDNGRIISDVYSYEINNRPLREDYDEDQKILAKFLRDKDPEQTEVLKKSILQKGQEQPAIITCDGFLINGNRRKMVYESLFEETHDPKFERMKVVILPGKDDKDQGGPPTIKEIEQIENRYQLQKDGKSEYSKFDRALTIRKKVENGMTLEEQLRDDPINAGLSNAEFKKAVQNYKDQYLMPLECIDEYLKSLGREGMYKTISAGIGDPEGKWQAFLDYYGSVHKKVTNEKERIKLGIGEDEVGKVQDVAFKLIRFREFPGLKVHKIMRDLPKFLGNDSAKDEIFKITKIPDLGLQERTDSAGREYSYDELDKIWMNKNRTEVIRQVQRAIDFTNKKEEMEDPLELLRQAHKKLENKRMNPDNISISDLNEAMRLAEKIETKASELRHAFYDHLKNKDKLKDKFKHTS